MASKDFLVNEYSDHEILSLDNGTLRIKQLNISNLGRLKMFSDDRHPEGFCWSSTLRTPSILKTLALKRSDLIRLGSRLIEISHSSLSVADKNTAMEAESHNVLRELNELGFHVKSFKMTTMKLFNPGISCNLLYENPDSYIKGPSFVLEDKESFFSRRKLGFEAMFGDGADIVTAQEVEFGESDDIQFSNVHDELMKLYDRYSFLAPPTESKASLVVTYFRKDLFEDVSGDNATSLDEMKTKLKCFGESDRGMLIVCLKHKETNKIFTVVNIHADYSSANTVEPWTILRDLFDNTPNLVVSGDFNLTLRNESYFRKAFEDFKGDYSILQTPEPIDIGNPTYDLILAN
jgi:hypothetical protein